MRIGLYTAQLFKQEKANALPMMIGSILLREFPDGGIRREWESLRINIRSK
jgi:hypothetical protein